MITLPNDTITILGYIKQLRDIIMNVCRRNKIEAIETIKNFETLRAKHIAMHAFLKSNIENISDAQKKMERLVKIEVSINKVISEIMEKSNGNIK